MNEQLEPAAPAPDNPHSRNNPAAVRKRLGPIVGEGKWSKLNCDVPTHTKTSLNVCKELICTNSQAEVIRKAIQLFELILREVKDGNRIILRRGKEESELRFL